MTKKVIAYLHAHWDREWYREFEVFRLRLLRVFDNVLDLLQRNKIPSFYFDGQVCALEDYLEIRPEKKELVENLIHRKKLFIGPFYCLVDEFLTDKTCFRKNLALGIKYASELGCTDFIGYLPDTFGHSQNIPELLMDFGIDKCVVWRGCGDFPAEFKWCGIDTINLVRGYFQDVFSLKTSIEEKAQILEKNLDLIAEKSGNYLLLPIGADHLDIECNITEQIESINELLSDKYEIILSNPFEYINQTKDRFSQFYWNDELRDNSKTFTLQGCYSSRLDLKRWNVECTYKLDLVTKLVENLHINAYDNVLEYAYKMLLRNQAHDSICGCSLDDVHNENIIRYKKILQIANGIIDEIKLQNHFDQRKILNLSGKPYTGVIEFESSENIEGYEKIGSYKGFDRYLLADTYRIPITEDYCNIHKYITHIEDLEANEIETIMPFYTDEKITVSENKLENAKISLKIANDNVYINGIKLSLRDYKDYGDSYNFGPDANDKGKEFSVYRTKIIMNTPYRASLKIDFTNDWDIVPMIATIEQDSSSIKIEFDWENTRKNHILYATFELENYIREVFSEDMNTLIKRNFDSLYNIRENLPKEKGKEALTNSAPMQRGLLIDENDNNIGVVTKGLTQYEIYKNILYIPILRATGVISNPKNPARTTPAGPPLEVESLQMIGKNKAEMYVFFGNKNDFYNTLDKVYNYIIL